MMKLLWSPSSSFVEESNLQSYKIYLEKKLGHSFDDYHALWQWSIDHSDAFWISIFEFFQLKYSGELRPVTEGDMPGLRWFEKVSLNYVQRIFDLADDLHSAIIWKTEQSEIQEMSWQEVRQKVADVQQYLIKCGVKKGDRVCAYMPNIPEASIALLATAGLGAVWSSCSPDFGIESVVDRFAQIKPKVLIACDGYSYNGKTYDKRKIVSDILNELNETDHLLFYSFLGLEIIEGGGNKEVSTWSELPHGKESVTIREVNFNDPLWVLYSSGTTGAPKAITHSHGGMLLEHVKYMSLHSDVKPGERFFWYSTTGWMMWNFVHASWLTGATACLYEGSAGYPDMMALWRFAGEAGIQHFGVGASFVVACMKAGISPRKEIDLKALRMIGSTGSPLPPEAFDWIYREVKSDLWLCSISGGTDVCTAFVGGCPFLPVYEGEIQCRALGVPLYSWDDHGQHENNRVGEMVVTKPMPAMPIYFWNDEDMERYRSAYFAVYPGIWRHGDWVEINDRGGLIIYGRSDATLNRQGVRIGTAEIYRALNEINEIDDALIVNIEKEDGRSWMPLFIKLNEGAALDDALRKEITSTLRSTYSPRHVPDDIIEVPDIPYTISGKKMEAPVKKILMGRSTSDTLNTGAMRNPESLEFYERMSKGV